MHANWAYCHKTDKTSINKEEITTCRMRGIPLVWKRSEPADKEGEARGRTDKDRRDLSFTFLLSPAILISWHLNLQTVNLCLWRQEEWWGGLKSPKLWHSESFSQTPSMYFRIMLQEISPRAESEVMTHRRSVPVRYRNSHTPSPAAHKCKNVTFFSRWQGWKWQIMCEKCHGSCVTVDVSV